jgi:hypothetical protein
MALHSLSIDEQNAFAIVKCRMKIAIYIGATIGGIIGGYLPTLWGAGLLDFSSIFWGSVGTIGGVAAAYYLAKTFDF